MNDTQRRKHEWGPSHVGHGEAQCKHCLVTNREAWVLGDYCLTVDTPPVKLGIWCITRTQISSDSRESLLRGHWHTVGDAPVLYETKEDAESQAAKLRGEIMRRSSTLASVKGIIFVHRFHLISADVRPYT